MQNHMMMRKLEVIPDTRAGGRFATLFLYEHGTTQDFTINPGEYSDFELAAQNALVEHANAATAPFSFQCTQVSQFLSVFVRAQIAASDLENYVLAVRINGADVLHEYLGIDNEIRINGVVWLLENDTLTLEIRAENRTATPKQLTVQNVAIGASELHYLPPSKIEEISD
jgi:hypothetical protein